MGYDLSKFFYTLIIPQYICLSLLYNFGILGNPNYKTKIFLMDKEVSKVIKSNIIYLYDVESKIETLLSFYIPFTKILKLSDNIDRYNYIITSNIDFLYSEYNQSKFKLIRKFDNHFLLMNISK